VLDNPELQLRPNMQASVSIAIGDRAGSLAYRSALCSAISEISSSSCATGTPSSGGMWSWA
jgi:hypothetical protein